MRKRFSENKINKIKCIAKENVSFLHFINKLVYGMKYKSHNSNPVKKFKFCVTLAIFPVCMRC